MQYFPSDEFIKSIVGTGASTLELPSGSALRVGGQFYEVNTILGLDMNVSGLGGLDTGTVAANTDYYIFIVEDSNSLYLVSSLNAEVPTGFPAYRRIGKIETDGSSALSVINADLINEVQQSQIETIQLTVSQNSTDIAALQATSGGSTTEITNLQTDVETLQTDVGNLQTDVSVAQTDIGDLQAQQATNTTDIATSLENINQNILDIATSASLISALDSQQITNTSNISTLQGENITQDSRLDSLETAFDPSFGHTHDGIDAPRVIATELSSAGSTEAGQFLSSDGTGGTVWGDLAANYQRSLGCGVQSVTSTSPVDVTNLSVTLTTKGGPVVLMLVPDETSGPSEISIPGGSAEGTIGFYRGATSLGNMHAPAGEHSPSLTNGFDPVAAGTYTYTVKASVTSGQIEIINYRLVAYEL